MASVRRNTRKPYSRPDVNDQWVHDRAPGAKRAADPDTNGLGKGPAPANARLMVSNLHYEITPVDLSKIFGQAGILVREPQIRYDRSGRSTGTAIITYETPAEATRAKNTFNNKTARGQAMTVEFAAPPRPQRAVSAPSTMKLLNRIEKPSLIERLSQDDTAGARAEGGVGPVRNKRGASKPQQPKQKKKPMTAEDLDRELEAFMEEPTAAEAPKPAGEDVEMA
ncbi:hypothetical protein HDZ31DRAFT_43032 [Schizophyllum fasciatum]